MQRHEKRNKKTQRVQDGEQNKMAINKI